RTQPEIDIALHLETLGGKRERPERVKHLGLGIRVQRQHPALLDQGTRHRFAERALRQAHFERLAAALISGFIPGAQRHCNVGPSPGMLGEVLRGLPATSARARLWQNQGKVGGFVQAPGRLPVRAPLTNETIAGLRAHDTVVVFNLIGQLHGSAGLSFRILRERNGRRVVGNSRKLPADITPECAANGRSAGLVDQETALSLPFALVLCAPLGASVSPPVVTTSSAIPLARMTSKLPAGTETSLPPMCASSPGCSPGKINGARPV